MNNPKTNAKTKVNVGGLMRCCTETLFEWVHDYAKDPAEPGTRVYCRYSPNDPLHVMKLDDLFVWRWDHT